MKKKNYLSKTIKAMALLLLSNLIVASAAAQFRIYSPSPGASLTAGEEFEFSWGKYNNNTDRYLWEWAFTGIKEENNVLIPFSAVYSGTNQEDWIWAGQKRSAGTFQIPCEWKSGAFIFQVKAQRRDWGFWTTQGIATSFNSLGINISPSPSPLALINCNPKVEFEINGHPKDGNTVYWYSDISSEYFFEGPVLKKKFPEGISTIYYAYGKKGTGKCENVSLRSPIAIFSIPISKLPNNPLNLGSYTVFPDPDPRLQIPRCSLANTYWKLPNEGELSTLLNPIKKQLKYGNIEVDLEPRLYWEAEDLLEPQYEYDNNNGIKVCYRNLEQVGKKSRRYNCYLTLDARINLYSTLTKNSGPFKTETEQILIASDVKSDCSEGTLIAYETISETDLCMPFQSLEVGPSSDDKLAPNCLQKEIKLICQDSEWEQRIGPPATMYNDYDFRASTNYGDKAQSSAHYTFAWSPKKGLYDPFVKNPIVIWDQMPNNINTFQLYKCNITEEITVRGATNEETGDLYGETKITNTYEWCALAFKCKNCLKGTGSKYIFIENPMDTMADKQLSVLESEKMIGAIPFYVYPNPSTENINIKNLHPENLRNAIYKLVSMDGKTIMEGKINSELVENQINISNISSGVYEILIFDDKSKIFNSRIIIMD